MDPGNWRESIRECAADEMEGADALMVTILSLYERVFIVCYFPCENQLGNFPPFFSLPFSLLLIIYVCFSPELFSVFIESQ